MWLKSLSTTRFNSVTSIERFLEGVSWLETSNDGDEQFDGYGRSSVQMVFSSLLSDARRKRRKVYFACLHAIDGEPQILGDDATGVSSASTSQPDHVLVVQDGRDKNGCFCKATTWKQ